MRGVKVWSERIEEQGIRLQMGLETHLNCIVRRIAEDSDVSMLGIFKKGVSHEKIYPTL
jgi:hypothetical protein